MKTIRFASIVLVSAAILCVTRCAVEKPLFLASDSKIQIIGRYNETSSGGVFFGASGVSFRFEASGDQIEAVFDQLPEQEGQYLWFQVLVDGQPTRRFRTENGRLSYVLAESLKTFHRVELIHETEGQQGGAILKGIRAGHLRQAPVSAARTIEFIGDSITCGFGNFDEIVPCGKGAWFDQHSAWRSYAWQIGKVFQSDVVLSSVSGIGISRNWNTESPTINQVYAKTGMSPYHDSPTWSFEKKVDLVVIALGTNDFSDGDGAVPRAVPDSVRFVSEYLALVKTVRSRFHGVPIILTDSPMLRDERKARLNRFLEAIKAVAGGESVFHFQYDGYFPHGCNSHPSAAEHTLMAQQLTAFIAENQLW